MKILIEAQFQVKNLIEAQFQVKIVINHVTVSPKQVNKPQQFK